MSLFIWKPSYELHVPEIDNDHRQLVGIINELYESMKTGRGHDVINRIVDRLIDYVGRHFDTEESFMRCHRFPGLEVHEAEHRRLRQQIADMDRQRREGNRPTTVELLNFLCEWLRNHIVVTDKEFGSYLQRLRA